MSRRLFVLGAVDLVVAAAVGLLIVRFFGVAGQSDTRPPTCSNRMGNMIDCGQDHWAQVTAWVVFGVVLLGLWTFHGRRALGFRHE
jgi:hypothetical protein